MSTKTIKVPFEGKGRKIDYRAETIDLSGTTLGFVTVYTVSSADKRVQEIIGDGFSILHNPATLVMPQYEVRFSGNVEEINLKKTIAQQVINDPD